MVPGAGTFVSRPPHRRKADTDWQQIALGASPVEPAGLDVLRRLRARAEVLLTGW